MILQHRIKSKVLKSQFDLPKVWIFQDFYAVALLSRGAERDCLADLWVCIFLVTGRFWCQFAWIEWVRIFVFFTNFKQTTFSVKDIQLGRRNLTPIQKISIAEKYRPIYEKQAKENQSKYYGNQYDKKDVLTPNSGGVQNRANETNTRFSKLAGVGKETYRMGAKILNSDNEKLKQEVLSGKKSINTESKSLAKKSTYF
mgnify:CR=1 FL=1